MYRYQELSGIPEASAAHHASASLGQTSKPANKFSECWDPQRRVIEATFLGAVRSVRQAAGVLGNAYGRPDKMSLRTRNLLREHFHTTDRDSVLEIFRKMFRIQRAFDAGLSFECEINCGKKVRCGYAVVTQWFGGFGKIHLCFDNRAGFCSFANLNLQEQMAVMIHEVAHRHVGISDKAYIWERKPSRDYTKLTPNQAMDNADSYAWFSVQL